jgi:transposase
MLWGREVSTKSLMGTTRTGRRRNRSWPEALKPEIVAASYAPGSSVSIVVRRYDVNANQVFNWRKHYGDDPHQPASPSAPQLTPVMITTGRDGVAPQPSIVAGKIEIHIGGRYLVCVDGGFDGQALQRALFGDIPPATRRSSP